MSNIAFYVPKLQDNGAWLDYRNQYVGGFGWRYDRALTTVKYAANHHSVTNPSHNAKTDCNTIWYIHRANGWGGIGYNFIITSEEITGKDGLRYAKVAYVGDIGSVRAHTPNEKGAFGLRKGYGNEDIIAACIIGQLHINRPTEAQIRSAYWLYRELITQEPTRLPNLKGTLANKLKAHKDFDATACPGDWAWQRSKIINYQDPPKIEKKEETRVATIPFGKREEQDPSLPVGQTLVEPGRDGEKKVIWEVTYTNGQETSRKVKSETITLEPVDEITFIGTYVEPIEPVDPELPEIPPELPASPKWLEALVTWIINLIKNIFKKG